MVRPIVAGFAMTGLLILSIISVIREPVTIWLFIVLFMAILILCAASAGKRNEQSYYWNVQGKRPDERTNQASS